MEFVLYRVQRTTVLENLEDLHFTKIDNRHTVYTVHYTAINVYKTIIIHNTHLLRLVEELQNVL